MRDGAFLPAGFRGRLLLIFLAISTVPLLATAVAFFAVLNANVVAETFGKLSFVRDSKRSEVLQYLSFAEQQAMSLTRSNAVRYAIGDFYGFSYAFRQIDPSPDKATALLQRIFAVDGPGDHLLPVDDDGLIRHALEYANAHVQFHEDFATFVRASEFDNVYLINADDRVVYSVVKDHYLGSDLTLGFRGTLLATLVAQARGAATGAPPQVSDFTRDPITGEFAAYIATRVEFYHKFRGTVVFRLPARGLNRLIQAQNGQAGTLYLVSSHHDFISAPASANVAAAAVTPALDRQLEGRDTAIVPTGLGGVAALSAWAPIAFGNPGWTLVAEVPSAIAFANAEELKRVLIIVAAISLPLLVLIVVVLSRTVTAPVVRITAVAEAIAEGDLNREMPQIASPRELSRLAASFRRMRDALRDQLSLVGQKNSELERQVRVIAEKNSALEEADRNKDTFLANTSHELRTPLHGIIGISETLAGGVVGELSHAQRNQLNLITFSARRLSRIVDDLLDLYRIRQGRLRLDVHPVHVASSVRNVLQLCEPMLRGEPLTLSIEIADDLGYVMADPVRFEQILYNLIGNAIKYTDHGSIGITAERLASGDVCVHVDDTGRGISSDSLERIFQPLEQIDGFEAARQFGGTGLGLTIARQLAKMLDGDISARSVEAQGSRFTVRLRGAQMPVTEHDLLADGGQQTGLHSAVDHAHDEPVLADRGRDDAAPQILVVDDEPVNLQVLRNVLQPQGYIVRSADGGRAALESVDRQPPDLILLDVMMPDLSGLEVARRIRQTRGLLDLPIIMVTARSRTRDVLAGFEHGANDYVVKPFMKDELLARIATLLEARRARGAARENLELRTEIERRVLVEDALRLSRQRMARLLDALTAAVICTAANGTITYANNAVAALTGRRIDAGITTLADLISPAMAETVSRLVRADGKVTIEQVPGFATPLMLSAFELEAEAGGGVACVLTAPDDARADETEGLVRGVQAAIDSVGSELMAGPASSSTAPAPEADDYRRTIVEVMVTSVSLWRRVTGKSKVDFAEASGIWRASFDRSSLQARTLDKYLLIETLPANPRWRDVVQTAEFVLAEVDPDEDGPIAASRLDLLNKLSALRSLLRPHLVAKRLVTAGAVD